jgi:hypothetical protein
MAHFLRFVRRELPCGNSLIRYRRNIAPETFTRFFLKPRTLPGQEPVFPIRDISGFVRCRKTAANKLAKNRAFRSKSSPCGLWAFRCNPLREKE